MAAVNAPDNEETGQNVENETEGANEPEVEVEASPTARPQSRGSISPSRKVISIISLNRGSVLLFFVGKPGKTLK